MTVVVNDNQTPPLVTSTSFNILVEQPPDHGADLLNLGFVEPDYPGKQYFGGQVVVLGTGNIAITDPGGAGAVFLYNGQTGALISTLFGAYFVTPLTNGNFVATGAASATWGSGTTGVNGTVSAANSLIAAGSSAQGTTVAVTSLSNGNYVVSFIGWNGNLGAVTWGNGTTGTTGIVSAANSLVGSNFGDYVEETAMAREA